jgi:hypothetical protein
MATPNSASSNPPANGADLSITFAQKYLQQIGSSTSENVVEHRFLERRRDGMAQNLLSSLRSVSAKSWTKTESLLAQEILLHGIDTNLIDPWQISEEFIKSINGPSKLMLLKLHLTLLLNRLVPFWEKPAAKSLPLTLARDRLCCHAVPLHRNTVDGAAAR